MGMEIIKTTGKTCAMMEHGGALVPSRGTNSFSSVQVLFGSTLLFSKAVKLTYGTPLSLWQQRIIYLSPLAIGMLSSFNNSQKEAPPPNNPLGEGDKKNEPQSHYPLMIYDNMAKVLTVASVVIISRKKGYHRLGGMCLQGSLLYARSYEVITIESYLVMQIATGVIGSFSKMIVAKSLSQRVLLFAGMVPCQLFNVYLFPAVKVECDSFLKEKVIEVIKSDEEIKTFLQQIVAAGWIDSSIMEELLSQHPHHAGGKEEDKDGKPYPAGAFVQEHSETSW